MKTLGESMMIGFPQVMSSFAMRPWKVRDPKARDHIGVGAFNLLRRSAYDTIGTYETLRLEVVDDLKLGESIKKVGLRQDVVFGRELVSLRWAVGAAGVVANLEKNLFAFLQFRISLVLAVCALTFFLCVCPFLGIFLAPGWAEAGFAGRGCPDRPCLHALRTSHGNLRRCFFSPVPSPRWYLSSPHCSPPFSPCAMERSPGAGTKYSAVEEEGSHLEADLVKRKPRVDSNSQRSSAEICDEKFLSEKFFKIKIAFAGRSARRRIR